MTPEEKEKQRKQQEMIEKAKFYSGNYAYNSWIVKQAEEDLKQRNENINDFIYAKLDEMIEETDDLETKNMILKKKEEFLQEDISNLKKQLRDR